jgi:hypothetical protein
VCYKGGLGIHLTGGQDARKHRFIILKFNQLTLILHALHITNGDLLSRSHSQGTGNMMSVIAKDTDHSIGDLLFSDKKARHRHVSFHMRDEKQIYFRLVMFHRPIIQHIAQFVKPFFVKNAHETSNIYNLFLFSPLLHGKTPKTQTNLTSIFTK